MARKKETRRRPARIARILVPTDFSEGASAALRWAAALAAPFGARLTILHAVDLNPVTMPASHEPVAAQIIDEVIGRLRADARAQMARLAKRHAGARTLIGEGNPRTVILRAARRDRADLIVMGTHGRTGLARVLFGSVAEHVVRHSPVPVVTVRRAGRR